MIEGTVRVWQNEPGYQLFKLGEPTALPSRGYGAFAILSGPTVLLVDLVEQVYSPNKAIERGAARPDVKLLEPTDAAYLPLTTWTDSMAEVRRLREFYAPTVKLRIR